MPPDWSRGRTLSSSARGDTTDAHGPLQRLLDVGDRPHREPRGIGKLRLPRDALGSRRSQRRSCLPSRWSGSETPSQGQSRYRGEQ
jgi:hypothetical protein